MTVFDSLSGKVPAEAAHSYDRLRHISAVGIAAIAIVAGVLLLLGCCIGRLCSALCYRSHS